MSGRRIYFSVGVEMLVVCPAFVCASILSDLRSRLKLVSVSVAFSRPPL